MINLIKTTSRVSEAGIGRHAPKPKLSISVFSVGLGLVSVSTIGQNDEVYNCDFIHVDTI